MITVSQVALPGCVARLALDAVSVAQTKPAATQPAIAPRNLHFDHAALRKLGWQLAVPTDVFKDLTVFEALDFLHPLTVHHVEISFNQPLSPDHPEWRVGPDMSAEQIDALMGKLKGMKMDIGGYHAGATPADEPSARKVFELAK